MANFITSLQDTRSHSQNNTIRRLLDKKIKSSSKYKDLSLGYIKSLSDSLREENLFKPLIASYADVGIDSFSKLNDLIDIIIEDFKLVYSEIDNINQIFEGINKIIYRDYLSIDRNILDLENQLIVTQAIDKEFERNGFRFGDVNFFNSLKKEAASKQIAIINNNKSLLYGLSFNEENRMVSSGYPKGLILPSSSSDVDIVDIRINEGSNTTESDLSLYRVDNRFIPENKLENILEQDNKIWAQYVYKEKWLETNSPLEYAKLELAISLDGLQEFNSIELNTASNFPVELAGISYLDEDGNIYDIYDFTSTLASNEAFNTTFPTKRGRRVFLKFYQRNFVEVNNVVQRSDSGPYINTSFSTSNNDTIALAIRESSSLPSVSRNALIGWVYEFGFNLIKISKKEFLDYGWYGSNGIVIREPYKTVGIDSSELIGNTITDNRNASYEYYIHRRDFNKDSDIVGDYFIPILPLNTTSIDHKYLNVNSNGQAVFLFLPKPGATYTVYKNFVPLTNDMFEASTDGGLLYLDDNEIDYDSLNKPYELTISIYNFDSKSVYTISFDDENLTSFNNENGKIYKDKDVYIDINNIVVFDFNKEYLKKVEKSILSYFIVCHSLDSNSYLRGSPSLSHVALYAN